MQPMIAGRLALSFARPRKLKRFSDSILPNQKANAGQKKKEGTLKRKQIWTGSDFQAALMWEWLGGVGGSLN